MRISSLYYKPFYTKTNNSNTKEKTQSPNFKGILSKDVFIKSLLNKKQDTLNNFKNFTINEYLKLTPQEIQELNIRCLNSGKTYIHNKYCTIHDMAASCVKTVFDCSFGKSNYEVLPIGRSLSSICKVLGYKIGENNIKNIPITNARRFTYTTNLLQADKNGSIDKFLEYLNSIGLNKNEIQASGKNYILMDYCVSGLSLKGIKNLFNYIYDSKSSQNFLAVDINKVLELINDDSSNFHIFLSQLNKDLFQSKYKNISTVNRCFDLEDTAKAIKDLSKDPFDVKLQRFKFLDNEMSNPESVRPPVKILGTIKRDY